MLLHQAKVTSLPLTNKGNGFCFSTSTSVAYEHASALEEEYAAEALAELTNKIIKREMISSEISDLQI